ncbi:hypothetical protein L1987_37609 [Smallanthus sonchifolius]|uniref:Uncharacterized protein n=1 Tax=Smallanthus sonchifolius TaxID=185202 RepID=A0ACB9HJE1_9ASTR|nr:hypothetical protein L1987_37609 [Smallanthus sonchifolius]
MFRDFKINRRSSGKSPNLERTCVIHYDNLHVTYWKPDMLEEVSRPRESHSYQERRLNNEQSAVASPGATTNDITPELVGETRTSFCFRVQLQVREPPLMILPQNWNTEIKWRNAN